MKISDIAKKLGVSIKDVRDKAKELNFVIAQKSNTMSDKKSKEFIEMVQKGLIGSENITEENKKEIENKLKGNSEEIQEAEKEKTIQIPEIISVKEFSEKMELPVTRVITELMKNGVMASINENIDFETAEIVSEYLGFKSIRTKEEKDEERGVSSIGKIKKERPPVITIIGHVDHGKTKLLDYIRKTNVIDTESGGITQHIGAYQIERKDRKITFLDTPGHAAFSAMREHGVRITDVAVLVVAADDGVMPQTKESVNFAREAGVPIVVAINKIDKPEANIEKTKRELSDLGLVPEEWGGETVMGNISAKTGQGVDELLDLILLVVDMKKIESFIDVPANGFVIESKMSTTKGPIATVLLRDGILKIGDAVTVGKNVYGKVRSMTDYKNKKVKLSYPSDPVRISGLSALPSFGDVFEVEQDLKKAKEKILSFKRQQSIRKINKNVFSLANASSEVREGKLKELKLVIKADVAGSLKAISDSLANMKFEDVEIKIINEGVGDINDSDVKMASATDSLILGFRVSINPSTKKNMESLGVQAEIFDIIYELIDKVTLALSGLLESEIREVEIGKGKILKIFKDGKRDKIIGVRVLNGKFEKDSIVKVFENEKQIAIGRSTTLKEGDKNVNEVSKGTEFGLGVTFDAKGEEKVIVHEDDSVIVYKKELFEKKLTKV